MLEDEVKTRRKRNPRAAKETGKNKGKSVFGARGSILRETNGNVSFTIIHFLKTFTVSFDPISYIGMQRNFVH